MFFQKDNLDQRKKIAMSTIIKSCNKDDIALFISHHIEELNEEYWEKHCGIPKPKAENVVEIIEFKTNWGEENSDNMDTLDFSLPDDITDYVISVRFSKNGKIESISMES
jgi:hypothetical protein